MDTDLEAIRRRRVVVTLVVLAFLSAFVAWTLIASVVAWIGGARGGDSALRVDRLPK